MRRILSGDKKITLGDMSNKESLQEKIEEAMKSFFSFPWKSKDFLTEDDIRCRLFLHLEENIREFENVSIHSEIRWYGEERLEGAEKLRVRSDIVLLDSEGLEDDCDTMRISSKGYCFTHYYSIVEIKLRRSNDRRSDDKYKSVVEKDIEKLELVGDYTTSDKGVEKSFYVIVFDKKKKKKKLIILHKDKNIEEDWDQGV